MMPCLKKDDTVGQGRTQGHLALAQITYVAPLCRKSWPLPPLMLQLHPLTQEQNQ